MSGNFEVTAQRSPAFFERFERKDENQHQTHYCPGCGHGVAHKLIAEALAELGLQDRTIMVAPVGCSVFTYYYFDVGSIQAAHGRAPAVATGAKRANPDSIVISYQGDGDLAAIGTSEIVHAANRGEKIAVFFINNSVYGMTGGQMAPTTLVGQVSTTTPWGRRPNNDGLPIKMAEMLSALEAPVYIERVALGDSKTVLKARKAVRKALELQKQGAGFTMVEILSPCPTIMKMEPTAARKWVNETLTKAFPLGVFRDRAAEIPQVDAPRKTVREALGLTEKEPAMHTHPRTRDTTMKIAGFGGQGVLLLGQLLAEMGMREHLEVSWLPSYGPEMRSGSCHCHVTLSQQRIGSPVIAHPRVLVAMNEPSLRKFLPSVPLDGIVFYSSKQLPDEFDPQGRNIICVPCAELADEIGSAKVSNVVMLGALLERTECLPAATAEEVLASMVKNPKYREMNSRALEAGRKFIDRHVMVGAVSQPDGFGE